MTLNITRCKWANALQIVQDMKDNLSLCACLVVLTLTSGTTVNVSYYFAREANLNLGIVPAIHSFYSVLAVAYDVFWLREKITWLHLLGICCIVGSLCFMALHERSEGTQFVSPLWCICFGISTSLQYFCIGIVTKRLLRRMDKTSIFVVQRVWDNLICASVLLAWELAGPGWIRSWGELAVCFVLGILGGFAAMFYTLAIN